MGRFIDVEIENTYEYMGHGVESLSEMANLLNFNLQTAQDINNYKTDVESIMIYAKQLAQEFVDASHPTSSSPHQPTHILRDSINYELNTSHGGSGARLYANAKDSHGHRYAGHIEYGFTTRDGIPRGPWPFLRPAMRIAAEASTGRLGDHMAQLALYGPGSVAHFGNLNFGRKNVGSQLRNNGGSKNVVQKTKQGYGSKSRGQSWKGAKNGIGFATGKTFGNTADSLDFTWGDL